MVLNLENDSAMKKDPLSFPGFKIIGFSYTVVSWHNKSQPIIAKVDFEFICQPFHPTLLTVVRFIPCCLFLQLLLALHPPLNDLLCPNFAGSRDKRTVVAHMWISNSFLVKMSIQKSPYKLKFDRVRYATLFDVNVEFIAKHKLLKH